MGRRVTLRAFLETIRSPGWHRSPCLVYSLRGRPQPQPQPQPRKAASSSAIIDRAPVLVTSRCRRYPQGQGRSHLRSARLLAIDHVAVGTKSPSRRRRRGRMRGRSSSGSDEGYDELALSSLMACLAGEGSAPYVTVGMSHCSSPPDCIRG